MRRLSDPVKEMPEEPYEEITECPVCHGPMHDCDAGYTNCRHCNPQPSCAICLDY